MEDMVQKVLWGHQVNQALKETQDAVALEVRLLMLCTNKLPLILKLGQSCVCFKLFSFFFSLSGPPGPPGLHGLDGLKGDKGEMGYRGEISRLFVLSVVFDIARLKTSLSFPLSFVVLQERI